MFEINETKKHMRFFEFIIFLLIFVFRLIPITVIIDKYV